MKNLKKGKTIDEVCGDEPGTFKKFAQKKSAHLEAIEEERKERIRASRAPPETIHTKEDQALLKNSAFFVFRPGRRAEIRSQSRQAKPSQNSPPRRQSLSAKARQKRAPVRKLPTSADKVHARIQSLYVTETSTRTAK